MTSRDVIKKLEQNGWFEVAQAGSHKQFKYATKPPSDSAFAPDGRAVRHAKEHRKTGWNQAPLGRKHNGVYCVSA
jgi:hypothetical protein